MRRHHCHESSQMLVVNGRYHITVSAAAAAAAAAAALIVVIGDNELRQHIQRHRFHINHAAITLNTARQKAAVFSQHVPCRNLCTS